MFENFDSDKSGALSAEELSKGLSGLGYDVRLLPHSFSSSQTRVC